MTVSECSAFALVIKAGVATNAEFYQILLDGEPVVLGTARIYKSIGSAKSAITAAVNQTLSQYNYWLRYVDNLATRNQMEVTSLIAAFDEIKKYHEDSHANMTYAQSITHIKSLSAILCKELLQSGVFRIEKL